jgi:hypothetical protein
MAGPIFKSEIREFERFERFEEFERFRVPQSFIFYLGSWFLVPGSFFCSTVCFLGLAISISRIKGYYSLCLGMRCPDVALPLGDQPINDSKSEVGVRLKRGKR